MKEKIDYILNSGVSNKQKEDALLELDRDNVDLGKGFTRNQKKDAKNNSILIYKAIKSFNKELGESFLNHIDK